MDDVSLAALKTSLLADLERLEAEIREIELSERESISEASGENAYRDHMADQGSATFERELDMTFEEGSRMHLQEVRAALERIQSGAYGTCERCGESIPVERLEAVPTAKLCVACKKKEEER